MRTLRISILNVLLLLSLSWHCSAAEPRSFTPSAPQRGVRISTDVITAALPAATLVTTLCLKDWQGLKQGVFSALVCAGTTELLKYTVREERPAFSNRHSFPSGHTATCFATATFITRRYGWQWGVPAYALGTYVAWGRVFSHKHHWWDVLAGGAIGAGSALIFTRPWAQKHEFTVAPSFTPGRGAELYASFIF